MLLVAGESWLVKGCNKMKKTGFGFMFALMCCMSFTMGCSEESATGASTSGDVEGTETAANNDGETFPSTMLEPKKASDFGEPCGSNDDCESGFCVEGPEGFICTQACLEICPDGFTCKAVDNYYPDVIFICIPNSSDHCLPCKDDQQCSGGTCALLGEGSYCLTTCDEDADCPLGNSCAVTGDLEGSCVPTNASCTCNEDGLEQSCSTENNIGLCSGIQTCDINTGWSLCSALEATAESCDYQDNDCDGVVDNGFVGNNGYDTPQHCGACNLNCDQVFPNAITSCNDELDTPLCVLVACEPGYSLIGDTQCVPSNVGLCEPCSTDENCVLDGSICMDVGGDSFCGTPCSTSSDCPGGFECKTIVEGIPQCYPVGNSCTCSENTPDLVKSCSVTWTGPPVTTCFGQQACGTDGEWEECALPAEICDNQDNNCDGTIDEGYRDETSGKYLSLENCGQCGNSCAFDSYENAEPFCDDTPAVPTCGMACDDGYFDVNKNPNDGCECPFLSNQDIPDADGLDANCDGIDGEVEKGIFVSKDGDDSNPGTLEQPVRTIQKALANAFLSDKRDVYVATGVYQEAIFLNDGINIYGGYRGDYQERDAILYETAILGPSPSSEAPGAINGIQIGLGGKSTTVAGFTIFGGNAVQEGSSSYAVYLIDCGDGVLLTNNTIYGGKGANGTQGGNGISGGLGNDGAPGVAGVNSQTLNCTASDQADGGAGGSLTCGSINTSGGNGGMRICPDAPDPVKTTPQTPATSEYGEDGLNSTGTDGIGGEPGWDSLIKNNNCGICSSSNTVQSSGFDGTKGSQGVDGLGGTAVSPLTGTIDESGLWEGPLSPNGANGAAGGGGGGGGAGGGVDPYNSCTTIYHAVGGSGGGGGSGGCPGAGGESGGPGGSSFAIFLVWTTSPNSVPTLDGNVIIKGSGGAGGSGGQGGVGGSGGDGGPGGISGQGTGTFPVVYCGAAGGYGGNGGNGGHGGGGAGGAGGLSFGIFAIGANLDSNSLGTNYFSGDGSPGNGGLGGSSYGFKGADGPDGNSGDQNF